MILEILSAGIVISACIALFVDEAVYAVAALAGTFMFTALLYALNGAIYVAIFQFAVGIGTLAILFLSGEMLSNKPAKKTPPTTIIALFVVGVLLSLPSIFLSITGSTSTGSAITFGEALWNFRGLDIVLEGLVLLTVALGAAIVLYEKRNGGK